MILAFFLLVGVLALGWKCTQTSGARIIKTTNKAR